MCVCTCGCVNDDDNFRVGAGNLLTTLILTVIIKLIIMNWMKKKIKIKA